MSVTCGPHLFLQAEILEASGSQLGCMQIESSRNFYHHTSALYPKMIGLEVSACGLGSFPGGVTVHPGETYRSGRPQGWKWWS